MVVRSSEARQRHGTRAEFLDRLHRPVEEFPGRYEGLLGHEMLVGRGRP